VSPTIFRARGYRFYFFSREESRSHVHVQHETGEAKIWLAGTRDCDRAELRVEPGAACGCAQTGTGARE